MMTIPAFFDDTAKILANGCIPAISLIYLTIKIGCKYMIRNLMPPLDFDFWEVVSWFAVDISVLNIVICIGFKYHEMLSRYEAGALWYTGLGFALLLCLYLYGQFNRRKYQVKKTPLKDFCLFKYISISWAISFGFFVVIIDTIKK